VKQRIRRFHPLQTAKTMAVLYGLVSILFVPVFMFLPGQSYGWMVAILIPVGYALVTFIVTAIGAAVYNLVSGWVGGIEFELEAPPAG